MTISILPPATLLKQTPEHLKQTRGMLATMTPAMKCQIEKKDNQLTLLKQALRMLMTTTPAMPSRIEEQQQQPKMSLHQLAGLMNGNQARMTTLKIFYVQSPAQSEILQGSLQSVYMYTLGLQLIKVKI